MKRSMAAILAAGLMSGLQAQEPRKDGDKIGKDKPPTVAKKALAEVQKRKSAAIAETAVFALGPQKTTNNFEGILRKDFAAVKGGAEVYARGSTYLMNTGARFDPPDQVQGQEGVVAQSFRNPSLLLEELNKVVPSATFGGDEAVDGKDCQVVDFIADPALVKQHLKDLGERMNKAFRGSGRPGAELFDFKNVFDEKSTIATYRVCVGKADLLIYRAEFVIKPKIKPGSLPPQVPLPQDLDQRLDVKFSKWDEEVAFEIPAIIKTKWGIK